MMHAGTMPLLLLVDDNPRNLEALALIFEDQGYRLLRAHSGPEALQKAVAFNPDLVLLDVLMPEMDGYAVCRRIRQTPEIAEMPVVMVTALSDTEARLRGFDAGADDFVSKPIDTLELRTRVRSITRMNRYRRLIAERSRQEQLIKLAPCGWIVCDDEGIIEMSNDRMAGLLQMVSGGDLTGLPLSTLFSRAERPRVARWFEDAFTRSLRLQTRLSCVGSLDEPWVEVVAGAFEHQGRNLFQVLVTDITQRKKLERMQMEEYFRKLVDGTTDLVATISEEGVYKYVSPAADQLLGRSPEEMIESELLQWVHPHDQAEVSAALSNISKESGARHHLDFRHSHRDGTWRNLRTTMRNALDDEMVGAIVVNAHDMTAQQDLWNQLLQAQKMDAVGQLAGGVAHDFNNLLAVILNYTYLARTRLEDDELIDGDMAAIERAANRGASLTRQLLTFSRNDRCQSKEVELNAVIREMESMLRPLLGRHVDFAIETSTEQILINADPSWLEQVVLNLVINARDAVDHGGRIEVVLDTKSVDEECVDSTQCNVATGTYARLRVGDDGCGMDEETLGRIFEPFFTTKAPNKGTGLGLSTIFGIMKKSKGGLFVTSQPGMGTTFELLFPMDCAKSETCAATGADEAIEINKLDEEESEFGQRIVVLEDDPDILHAMEEFLGEAGHKVFATAVPIEAVDRCAATDDVVTLLITDLMMPDLTGVDVMKKVRRGRPDLPCICISGCLEKFSQDLEKFDDIWVLPKPFSLKKLTEMIEEALSK